MRIQILGSGCKKCDELYARARQAAERIKWDEPPLVEKVDDIDVFLQHGVRVTPALVVAGELVSSGQLLEVEQIEQAIRERLAANG